MSDIPARSETAGTWDDLQTGETRDQNPGCNRRTMLSAMAGSVVLSATGTTGGVVADTGGDVPRATADGTVSYDSFETGAEPATLEGRVTTQPVSSAERVLVGTTQGLYVVRRGTLEAFVSTQPIRAVEPVADDRAVVLTEDAFFPNILLVDTTSGERIWSATRTTEVYNHERGAETRQVAAFDAAALGQPAGDSPDVVVATAYGVVALAGDGATDGAENTDVLWERDLDVHTWRVAVDDGTAYVSTQDGRVLALDAESGQLAWEADVAEPYDGVSRSVWDVEPVQNGDRLFVTTEDGYVKLLDADDGTPVWQERVLDPDEDDLDRYYRDTGGLPTMPGGPNRSPDPYFFNVEATVVGEEGFAVTTVDGLSEHERSVELTFLNPDGTLEWTADGVSLEHADALCYCSNVDENALFVLEPPGGGRGPDTPDREIVRLDLDSGSEDGRLELPIAPRKGGRDALVSDGDALVLAPEVGGLEAIDAAGDYVWGFPAVEDGAVFRADLLGDGVFDYLVYEPGDDGRDTAALVVRSGADGTIAWARTLSAGEQLEDGAFRDVRAVASPDGGVDLIALTQRPETEADDEIRSLENDVRELEREIDRIEGRPDGRDDEIDQLRDEIDDKLEEIEALGGRRVAHVVVLSGADGSERRRIPFRIPRENLDELVEPESMDVFGSELAIVGAGSAVYLVDLVTEEIFWERQYRESDFWPPVGERAVEYRTVASPGHVDNVLALDRRELELGVVETSVDGEDIVFEGVSTLDLDGDHIERIELLGDVNDDGHDDVGLLVRDSDGFEYVVVGTGDVAELVRFDGGEAAPTVRVTVNPDDEEDGAIGALVVHSFRPEDEESVVTVWDGSQRFRLEQTLAGQARGLREQTFAPVALAGDVDGDGTEEVGVAMAAPDGDGVVLTLYDLDTGEEESRIVLESFDEVDVDDDLVPAVHVDRIPDGTADGDVALGVITDAGLDGSLSFFVVDPVEERVIASGDADDGEFVGFGDDDQRSVGLLGSDASLRAFDPAASVTLDEPDDASEITLTWTLPDEREHVSSVRVNGRRVTITNEASTTLRLPDGTHDVEVTATNPAGITTHDSATVTVDEGSITNLLLSAITGISVALLFAIGLADDIRRRLNV